MPGAGHGQGRGRHSPARENPHKSLHGRPKGARMPGAGHGQGRGRHSRALKLEKIHRKVSTDDSDRDGDTMAMAMALALASTNWRCDGDDDDVHRMAMASMCPIYISGKFRGGNW